MRTAIGLAVLAAALGAGGARADDFKCPKGARDSGLEKGQPRWCESMVKGKLVYDGPLWRFHADGSIASKETYVKGDAQGSFESWHANGKRETKGQYRKGEAVGTWKTWDDRGRIVSETRFDLPRATRTAYHPNGKKWASGRLLDGAKVGTWTVWDDAGKEVGRCDLGEGVVALPPGKACAIVAIDVDPKGFGRPTPLATVAGDGTFTLRIGSEAYAFTPPEGWVADVQAGKADRLPVILHPRGSGAWDGPATIYLRPIYRDGKSFEAALAAEVEAFKKDVMDYETKPIESGTTGLGRPFQARAISYRATRPGPGGGVFVNDRKAQEAVASIDASDQVVVLVVLASGEGKQVTANTPALLSTARSARKADAK
jgi:hypothetical protein